MRTLELETALAQYFNPRQHVVVPNVWWGLGLNHECDLFVVTAAGYAYEVEIKVSKSDLLADLKKRHGHVSEKIRRLYYCVPVDLLDCCAMIAPERSGILYYERDKYGRSCIRKHREARNNSMARRLTDKEVRKVMHLGCMRIWTLKRQLKQAMRTA